MPMYEFSVDDSDGARGHIRVYAQSEQEARVSCKANLEENSVDPAGSLQPGFTLELIGIVPIMVFGQVNSIIHGSSEEADANGK